MDKLAKICEVLALKRSRAERQIAESKMRLLALCSQVETMEVKISDISAESFPNSTSNDPIGDAIILEQWRDMTLGNIHALQIEKKNISSQLIVEKQVLKEILVKEDVVISDLKAKRRAHEQECLESESSARLENWIVSQSCSS